MTYVASALRDSIAMDVESYMRSMTIGDALDLWAHWRRGANLPPTGGARSALRRLYAEGDEVKASSRRVQEGERVMKRIRTSITLRLQQRRRELTLFAGRTDLNENEEALATRLRDDVERLQRVLAIQPRRASQLASPGMIHGQGAKKAQDYPLEEALDLSVSRLPHRYREVIRRNYLNPLPQTENARQMRISERTFRTALRHAESLVARDVGVRPRENG